MATTWVVAVGVPVVLTLLAAFAWTAARCDPDQVDCSWGFEYLLAVPVYALAVLVLAPFAVWAELHRHHDPNASATAWWCVPVGALLAVTCVGVLATPWVARWLALRRRRRHTDGSGGAA